MLREERQQSKCIDTGNARLPAIALTAVHLSSLTKLPSVKLQCTYVSCCDVKDVLSAPGILQLLQQPHVGV